MPLKPASHEPNSPLPDSGARAGLSGRLLRAALWGGGAVVAGIVSLLMLVGIALAVAFPNLPDENFSHKLNKKMYRAGMCSILSQLAREERLVVIDDIKVDAPKTKMLAEKVKGFGFDTSVLFITGARDENLTLASRNLMNVSVLDAQNADPVSLVNYDRVLLTKGAVERMKEIFA